MRGTRGSTRSRLRTAPWDRNELWRRAQAIPSLDQRFAEDKSLVDHISGQNLITFTRASSATFVGSNGVLQTAVTNAPRFDHNPVTGESLGLLVEEQRTNSIRNNTMVGAVAGTPGTLPTNWMYAVGSGGISREVVGTGVENGINYIDLRFYGTTTNANPIAIGIDSGVAATGQTWNGSLYWKLVGGTLAGITGSTVGLIESTSGASFVTGAFYAAANPSSSALSLQRVNATRTLSGGATVGLCSLVLNFTVTNSTAIDFTLRIGLPQLEQGAFATSPILTSDATATRSADVASITGSNFSSWYRQDEGTVFAEWQSNPTAYARYLVSIEQAATSATRIDININSGNTVNPRTVVSGAAVATLAGGTYTAGTIAKVAFGYKSADYASSFNGAAAVTSATAGAIPSSLTIMYLGSLTTGTPINGHIRRLTYFPQRLYTLQSLTS